MSTDKPGCHACTPSTPASTERHVTQPDKTALINRLKRIEGQVGGILNMVQDDRYCVDILTQLSAVKSALDGVGVQVLTSHAKGCVRTAIAENGGEEALEELMSVIRKMVK